MLTTAKHLTQGFAAGIVLTVLIIGICHIEIRFSMGPEAMELTQTEQIATKLAQVMPQEKPQVRK
jgi:uncharacterized membrane protein YciS (DUF1049 family)